VDKNCTEMTEKCISKLFVVVEKSSVLKKYTLSYKRECLYKWNERHSKECVSCYL